MFQIKAKCFKSKNIFQIKKCFQIKKKVQSQ